MSDFPTGLDRVALERIVAAGRQVLESESALNKTGDNVVGAILRDQGTFFEWNHYPEGDVYDGESHSQYFYHAHAQGQRANEHGHFHTFLRPKGMPSGIRPARVKNFTVPKDDNEALCHIIGMSMDKFGKIIRLFTPNRWVTGETWYVADDVVCMLDNFIIGHTRPSWPTNRWVSGMVQLFRPQIAALVAERDASVAAWEAEHEPDNDVYEDRRLEITSERDVAVEDQLAAAERALASK